MRRTAYAVVVAAVALGAAPVASARIVATKGFGPGAGRIVIARGTAATCTAWRRATGRRSRRTASCRRSATTTPASRPHIRG